MPRERVYDLPRSTRRLMRRVSRPVDRCKALALAALTGLAAACGGPKPEAPEAGVSTLLQAPQASIRSLRDLRGQVVVLEFWATWCGPCLSVLPYMNWLESYFKDKPVRFISVTDEPRERVEAYLKEHPMRAWIGLDPGHELFDAFHVRFRPEVFVIDPYGRILHDLNPAMLERSDISSALKATPPSGGEGAKPL